LDPHEVKYIFKNYICEEKKKPAKTSDGTEETPDSGSDDEPKVIKPSPPLKPTPQINLAPRGSEDFMLQGVH
jgi:hypothetical protein